MPPFRLGINYWPARTAMAMWTNFDAGAIDADFARIAAAGLSSVRFFLLWEDFQPAPDRIDASMLDKLERVLELLAAHGLRGMPTLFCGHMSGVNWLPGWTLDPSTPHGRFRTISDGAVSEFGIGDFYTPGPLLAAQRDLARAVGKRFRGCEAIEAWDLGNEFSNLREPSSPEAAAFWSRTLTSDLVTTSGIPVTGGIHGEDLERDRHLRPSSICEPWEFATMHGYSVYSGFSRGRLDADVVPFLETLVASFTRKPVLFSEFGNPSCPPGLKSPYDRVPLPGEPALPSSVPSALLAPYACLDDDEMAQYASAVLDRLQRQGALGGYWWNYSDYDEQLKTTPPFDLAPHEMRFGAWRADGTPKPVVAALTRFAAERREVAPAPEPFIDEQTWYTSPMHVTEEYAQYVQREEVAG